MKILKCIGGPWDGRKVVLQGGQHEFVVRECPKLSVVRFDRTATWEEPTVVTLVETVYVIDAVHCDGDTIEYLRPRNWSSKQALLHALVT